MYQFRGLKALSIPREESGLRASAAGPGARPRVVCMYSDYQTTVRVPCCVYTRIRGSIVIIFISIWQPKVFLFLITTNRDDLCLPLLRRQGLDQEFLRAAREGVRRAQRERRRPRPPDSTREPHDATRRGAATGSASVCPRCRAAQMSSQTWLRVERKHTELRGLKAR